MREPAFATVWEFRIRPEVRDAFLRHRGPGGTWARQFGRGEGYVETVLLDDRDDPDRYLTIDGWRDAASYEGFQSRFAHEYGAIDVLCAGLTRVERALGSFQETASQLV